MQVLLFNVIEKLSNNSFDYRKHLNDIRQEISIIGRKNHDAEQTIKRYLVYIEIDAGGLNSKCANILYSQVKSRVRGLEIKE